MELTRFFFALVVLLSSAQFFGYLFKHFRLPKVIGEIFGGLMLGPTVLGAALPGAHDWLFNAFAGEGKLISIIYWFGLILLMFVSGFEVQKTFSGRDRRIIGSLVVWGTFIPFIAGWFATLAYDFSPYLGHRHNMLAFQIVVAIVVAVTSIPVISKIFLELKVIDTRFAKIVLATATIHDILLWVALAIATGLVAETAIGVGGIVRTVAVTIVFFVGSLVLVPRMIRWGNRSKYNLLFKASGSGYVLFICFTFSAVACLLDVNIVFGAFLAGIVVGLLGEARIEKARAHIREISLGFFVPVYFAIVGLKLDLIHHFDIWFFAGFLLFSTVLQTAGTLLAARLTRVDWLSSVNLSVAMNTRGGPGIVLATIAYDLGIINATFFGTLVMVAIVTSLLAGAWFRFALGRGWELMPAEPESAPPRPEPASCAVSKR